MIRPIRRSRASRRSACAERAFPTCRRPAFARQPCSAVRSSPSSTVWPIPILLDITRIMGGTAITVERAFAQQRLAADGQCANAPTHRLGSSGRRPAGRRLPIDRLGRPRAGRPGDRARSRSGGWRPSVGCANVLGPGGRPVRPPYSVMTEWRVGVGCGDLALPERPRRLEQPVERLAQLGDRSASPAGGQIALDVVHRARQDVQLVVQLVERRLRDHQLAVAQLQLARPAGGTPSPTGGSVASRTPGCAPVHSARAALAGTTGTAEVPS